MLQYAHVGDSRIYLFHGHSICQLTKDHSIVQELVEQGYIREDRTEVVDGRARTYYAITPEGAAYFSETSREYEELSTVFLKLLKGGAKGE